MCHSSAIIACSMVLLCKTMYLLPTCIIYQQQWHCEHASMQSAKVYCVCRMRRLCWSACTLAQPLGKALMQVQRMLRQSHARRAIAASMEYTSVPCYR